MSVNNPWSGSQLADGATTSRTTEVECQSRRCFRHGEWMTRYLFSSHDGYGLGHVRRNTLIAEALLRLDPSAQVALVTGLRVNPSWSIDQRITIVRVPSLLKDSDGSYRHETLPFEEALTQRAAIFTSTVETHRPDVVVVDRHPYGIGNELRFGLERAKNAGARLVLGLRDILDEPEPIRAELTGKGWEGATEMFDDALVYGGSELCDHVAEYGLPIEPTYCGWVVEHPHTAVRDAKLLVVTAGGGGDGQDVFELGLEVFRRLPRHRGVFVAGPYAAPLPDHLFDGRVQLLRDAPGCVTLFASASAVLQMAGYNSTFESLAAGIRPVLMPRRSPRREQAIRATRLAALGLADVVDDGAAPDEVAWLLQRRRFVSPRELQRAGIVLAGADHAARALSKWAGRSTVTPDNSKATR
jgi:predicted glycosyltransferase